MRSKKHGTPLDKNVSYFGNVILNMTNCKYFCPLTNPTADDATQAVFPLGEVSPSLLPLIIPASTVQTWEELFILVHRGDGEVNCSRIQLNCKMSRLESGVFAILLSRASLPACGCMLHILHAASSRLAGR